MTSQPCFKRTPAGIFFLDAGRKFFGVPAVTSLLRTAADAGLDAMILYFSDNQGFRFGLDDRVIVTPYGSYDLTSALGDGYCEGNKSPDGSGKYWSEADMEQILSCARSLGVELIPALNMPGHLGTILEQFPHLRYPGSRSSIDLRREEAVSFALTLLERYASWFAKRGCRFFCLGGDEFANDLGQMGFDVIYHNGEMKHFISFLNRAAGLLADLGLTPMAFNDGIYYQNDTVTYGPIDNRIWVLYWTGGWDTYHPAAPATLHAMGFPMVNSGHRYYCGSGCPDWNERAEVAATFDCDGFDGGGRVPAQAGMLCCWNDRASFYGTDDGETLSHLLVPVINAFGKAIQSDHAPEIRQDTH